MFVTVVRSVDLADEKTEKYNCTAARAKAIATTCKLDVIWHTMVVVNNDVSERNSFECMLFCCGSPPGSLTLPKSLKYVAKTSPLHCDNHTQA